MRTLYVFAAICAIVSILCACGTVVSGSETTNPDSAVLETDTDSGTDNTELTGTNLEVYGFQAGKADAFLFTTENSTVLIDAGEKGFGREILAYLEDMGIEKLDYMIITHFDQDHVGGAARIINNFRVDNILQNNRSKDSEEYEKYVKAVRNAGIEPVTVQEDMEFMLDGVKWSVNPPRKSSYRSDTSNNCSLIVTIQNGADRMLFMGDAQTERIEEFLTTDYAQPCDVLKVPHHGKEEILMSDLLEAVQPEYAIITSSEEEPEEESVLSALAASDTEVYLTRTAPIWIQSDGTSLTIAYDADGAAA